MNLDLNNGQAFNGSAMRSYEIMSCAGVLACAVYPDFDPKGELEGSVYVKYDGIEDFKDKVDYYKANPAKKDELRKHPPVCRGTPFLAPKTYFNAPNSLS